MKKKLLFVDDEAPSFVHLLPRLMPEYELRLEEDGRAALAIAGEFQPDVILLDLIMPHIRGLDLAALLRADARFARTPIIIVSGCVRASDDDLPTDLGGYPAFSKPINMRALKKCIEQQLRESAGELPNPSGGDGAAA